MWSWLEKCLQLQAIKYIYAIQDKVNLIQNVLTRNKSKGHDIVKGVAIINTPVIISLSAKNDNFWKVVTQ